MKDPRALRSDAAGAPAAELEHEQPGEARRQATASSTPGARPVLAAGDRSPGRAAPASAAARSHGHRAGPPPRPGARRRPRALRQHGGRAASRSPDLKRVHSPTTLRPRADGAPQRHRPAGAGRSRNERRTGEPSLRAYRDARPTTPPDGACLDSGACGAPRATPDFHRSGGPKPPDPARFFRGWGEMHRRPRDQAGRGGGGGPAVRWLPVLARVAG